jgi:hypothetical protein
MQAGNRRGLLLLVAARDGQIELRSNHTCAHRVEISRTHTLDQHQPGQSTTSHSPCTTRQTAHHCKSVSALGELHPYVGFAVSASFCAPRDAYLIHLKRTRRRLLVFRQRL